MELDRKDIEVLLALLDARSPAEAEREAARLRGLLGAAAPKLEPHIDAVLARTRELRRAELAAATDPLTGLANRRAFDEALRRELARARRSASAVAVLMLDLDGFKSINDTWGHLVGDRVLKVVARCAREHTREGDLVGRLGGDELALILPDTTEEGARAIGERIRAELLRLSSEGPMPGLSFGVAVARRGHRSLHGLLADADRELYRDKAARRMLKERPSLPHA